MKDWACKWDNGMFKDISYHVANIMRELSLCVFGACCYKGCQHRYIVLKNLKVFVVLGWVNIFWSLNNCFESRNHLLVATNLCQSTGWWSSCNLWEESSILIWGQPGRCLLLKSIQQISKRYKTIFADKLTELFEFLLCQLFGMTNSFAISCIGRVLQEKISRLWWLQ